MRQRRQFSPRSTQVRGGGDGPCDRCASFLRQKRQRARSDLSWVMPATVRAVTDPCGNQAQVGWKQLRSRRITRRVTASDRLEVDRVEARRSP